VKTVKVIIPKDLKPSFANVSFCFSLLDDKLEVVSQPRSCKDYFQDMWWAANMGIWPSVYALTYNRRFINLNSKRYNFAIVKRGLNLLQYRRNWQKFINVFEEAQGIKPSKIRPTEENSMLVINFDRAWTSSGPMLSTLTTLIRIGCNYKGEGPIEYLKNCYKNAHILEPIHLRTDASRLSDTLPKLAALLQGKKVSHEWKSMNSCGMAHLTGIMGFRGFPAVPVEGFTQ
jgi:hypothetical protein